MESMEQREKISQQCQTKDFSALEVDFQELRKALILQVDTSLNIARLLQNLVALLSDME